MALTKAKKSEIVAEIGDLLDTSKLTVVAQYTGTPVKEMQALRREARDTGTKVQVVKNRLVKQALKASDKFKTIESDALTGQLLYAFNKEDEVAPAQVLANFAKSQPTISFVGGFSKDGVFMSADDIKALSALPGKDQLRAQLVGTISAPISGFVGVLSGNVRSLLNVLSARSEALNN